MIYIDRDCNIFGGGIFGYPIGYNNSQSDDEYVLILTGDAFSVDKGTYINAGTSKTRDLLKYHGGNSFN